MLTIYEYPVCSTCKKAKAELKTLGLEVDTINIKETPPSKVQLKAWLDSGDYPLKSFFNTSGNSYKALGLKDKLPTLSEDEALDLLAADGMLIKRPILADGDKVLQIGYRKPYEELGLA
ncbi:arsenate reductase family protein [Streptococcus moroccensis]|uniref:Arsenate reductase n=1 Tax=Streptococcus moroccensis TaxID=1451356 RepID=A0ABT9YQP7_9STRE|nr:arsenate reductase family protein [Streptococcus moroccensis]MDQ0222326.1 arsenate reductase [Streptococcus moroccensis]